MGDDGADISKDDDHADLSKVRMFIIIRFCVCYELSQKNMSKF